MARIAFGLGTSHGPMLSIPPEVWPDRVLIDLGCSSHNAMSEKNHTVLFRASQEWLTRGSVNGTQEGMLRLGY